MELLSGDRIGGAGAVNDAGRSNIVPRVLRPVDRIHGEISTANCFPFLRSHIYLFEPIRPEIPAL